jgi:2-iminobutanoate/2-iminopropanoate deaminase
MRKVIATDKAPQAVGPYAQGIAAGGLVWVSGQIPLDPATGRMVEGDVGIQTRQALTNVRGVLEAAGSRLDRVIRATVYLTSMDDFRAMNEVYATFFTEAPPARACVEVSRLPRDARVEIDAVALAGD